MVFKLFNKSLLALIIITVSCAIYTEFITIIGQTFFHNQANGSLIIKNNQIYGSKLLSQPFSGENYLWGRQMNLTVGDISGNSKSQSVIYSSASQLSPNDTNYQKSIKEKKSGIQNLNNKESAKKVPVELITNSGSGLDPEISPSAAMYQASRIAASRKINKQSVVKIIKENTKQRTLGVLGEPRVNVLEVNLALDNAASQGD
ncbi:hypothetical protein LH61_04855 [Leuconostoc mesenteroides P45]|uniref:K(+)-transporting ATPase subunit C n=1 Tax=Leuconostoc mesenteroides TaxID=1245 RepID=UPI000508A61F|nr:K(+)-transporting ATPase subunit C [Leuconostoc mesenteroides]KGB50829.1 hypothetical protein LH61_04855 [Leuconostoc mesenteroides P45]